MERTFDGAAVRGRGFLTLPASVAVAGPSIASGRHAVFSSSFDERGHLAFQRGDAVLQGVDLTLRSLGDPWATGALPVAVDSTAPAAGDVDALEGVTPHLDAIAVGHRGVNT